MLTQNRTSRTILSRLMGVFRITWEWTVSCHGQYKPLQPSHFFFLGGRLGQTSRRCNNVRRLKGSAPFFNFSRIFSFLSAKDLTKYDA